MPIFSRKPLCYAVLTSLLLTAALTGCSFFAVPTAPPPAAGTTAPAETGSTPGGTAAAPQEGAVVAVPTAAPAVNAPTPEPTSVPTGIYQLLNGVGDIAAPGYPGHLCVYGPTAFPVVTATTGDLQAPVVAAAQWDKGRVVVFGHDGYFNPEEVGQNNTGTGIIMHNALLWTAQKDAIDLPAIGVVGAQDMIPWLAETAELDAAPAVLTAESLSTFDAVTVIMWNQTEQEVQVLADFIRSGGGLVTAATGWGWAQLHPDMELRQDYAGNRLLAPTGIQWSGEYARPPESGRYPASRSVDQLTHGAAALESFQAHRSVPGTITDAQLRQAADSIRRNAACLPDADSLLTENLREFTESAATDGTDIAWPTAAIPTREDQTAARLTAALYVTQHNRTPAEAVQAHPASADFPGPVPTGAPRISRTVSINKAVPRWHSTGLYAAPGEQVTVTMPDTAPTDGSFHVRVGSHTANITRLPQWPRMPEVSRRFPVTSATTTVANAFGGLIYVEVPAGAAPGNMNVHIEGAVEAPLFVLGQTDPEEWRNSIRHAPGPWAEVAGRNIIVTTPSSQVRDLDHPDTLAETWDRAVDLAAELAAWPGGHRPSPERFIVDRQPTAGTMYSGYPLTADMAHQSNLVDSGHLRSECNWGFYHVLGYNHQEPAWTFDGSLLVTVNLFTLYIYDHLCAIPVTADFAGSTMDQSELLALYDFDNPDFETWKQEPFLALIMYSQLQQAFGWEPYRQVFAIYRQLPESSLPHTDAEKRDFWMVTLSRQVGRDLGPFFQAWGVPTSQEARDSIHGFPVWLPPDFLPAP